MLQRIIGITFGYFIARRLFRSAREEALYQLDVQKELELEKARATRELELEKERAAREFELEATRAARRLEFEKERAARGKERTARRLELEKSRRLEIERGAPLTWTERGAPLVRFGSWLFLWGMIGAYIVGPHSGLSAINALLMMIGFLCLVLRILAWLWRLARSV